MPRKLSIDADIIVKRFKDIENPSWDTLRDYCDGATAGDLDCIQLDLLTDMVERRLKARKRLDDAAVAAYVAEGLGEI